MSPEKDPNDNCDGKDDDCDGEVDNAPICWNPGQVDSDGDGYDPSCEDCNDNSADTNPGALDAPCDGEDKDCDGNAEDADTGCACTVGDTKSVAGSCADGEDTCQLTGSESSGWVTLTAPNNGIAEVCANDVDDDCDGIPDACDNCPEAKN